MSKLTSQAVFQKYESAYNFKSQIGLYDTVQVNEDFFIGKQWENVQANGLPTPTFNVLKQVVNFQVATITSDNFTLQASPLASVVGMSTKELESDCFVINKQFSAIIERNRIVSKMREFLRNAAVDGDGSMYFRFDPSVKNGQKVTGEITAEITENTRVGFGNPNCRDVQKQPWVIISRRDPVESVRNTYESRREDGDTDIQDAESIVPDSEIFNNTLDSYTDDKVTVLMYFSRDPKTGHIMYAEATNAGFLMKPYDTELTLYPLIWLSWDIVHDCYHGQAMISGLIPNQKFINKMFAMVGISLMTSAFPKIVYDRTKIKHWSSDISSAVGVNGNVEGVAKTIQGASVNPQIAQFIQLAMDMTKSLLGASDVALGDSRPDNTSAIIALQRAANTPMEMTKQNMYQCIDDMGRILIDMMSVYYGKRIVEQKWNIDDIGNQPLNMEIPESTFLETYDFSRLKDLPLAIRLDAGASSYWSEIASMQTIDNLLMNNKITLLQYLERVPSGYITEKQKLMDEIRGVTTNTNAGTGVSKENVGDIPIPTSSGNGALQRAVVNQGV